MDKVRNANALHFFGVSAAAVLGGLLFSQFGLLEQLARLDRAHGSWMLDEVAGAALAAILTASIYVWRHNRASPLSTSARIKAELAGSMIAKLDILTGLPNRSALYEALAGPSAPKTPGSVYLLMMDLDRFKPLNDLRGHTAGDRILRKVSERLSEMAGPNLKPYRLGGDQFAVLIGAIDTEADAIAVTERIIATTAKPFVIEDWRETLTCSVGLAKADPDASSADFINQADQAMHHAKAAGGGKWALFNDELGDALREKAMLAAELRDAVHTDSLLPFFQPILKIETGELIGFEVLARWNRSGNGFVPPDVFIPMAEELGLIDRLSDQLLTRCCEAMQTWEPSLTISFNLSPRQLNHEGLAKRIGRILETAGIEGHRLAIEITETAVFIDIDRARDVISELRELGVRVSLDDFGIGTSSLAVLSQLPFDTLKIDRSFISDIDNNPQNAKIVRGVLALARSLELTVTAEGIESDEDLAFLKTNNCVLGQGYLFSRPVPEDALPQLVEDVARAAAINRQEIVELPAPMTTLSPLTAQTGKVKGRRAN